MPGGNKFGNASQKHKREIVDVYFNSDLRIYHGLSGVCLPNSRACFRMS
jgi:hypothetical protein